MVNTEVNTDQIFNWISDIPDSGIPVISIKDLGMLHDVMFENGNYVVTITPTYTACPAMKIIEYRIMERLQEHRITDVKVNLTYTSVWTTDRLSEEAKLKMQNYCIAPPQHSSCNKVFKITEEVLFSRCNSKNTGVISRFGSTACKTLYKCLDCKEHFEFFKYH